MKRPHTLIAAALLCVCMATYAADVVPVGQGSYAATPPASEGVDEFANQRPIYVADDETRPIPTNDWWTDLIASRYGGELWAYPLVLNPEEDGMNVQFPIGFNNNGTDAVRGPAITVKGQHFAPTQAMAKNWDDWMVTAAMPDGDKRLEVTLAHGIPFAWFDTHGFTPEFAFGGDPEYLAGNGQAAQFPITGGAFAVAMDGRYFGIHLGQYDTAQVTGRQWVEIDLGQRQPISDIALDWEAAYAKGYAISVSDNGQQWRQVYSTRNGDGGQDNITGLNTSGRYVRLNLQARGTVYAYSLWEFQVYNGNTLLSENQPVLVSSTQTPWDAAGVNDGNPDTRWASDPNAQEKLVITPGRNDNSQFVISALPALAQLATYDQYAHNVPTSTRIGYQYDPTRAQVTAQFDIQTTNSEDGSHGPTIQGFLPHQYRNTHYDFALAGAQYVSPRGTLKTAIGKHFSFTYAMPGLLPNFPAPQTGDDVTPYDPAEMNHLITRFADNATYGDDTYFGGKDLVNLAKYTLMAKQLQHPAYAQLAAKTQAALTDWLTYTPGEKAHYFARYPRWGALIGFDPSYGSERFTDNHFHYGYLVTAAAMYGLVNPQFLEQYGPMVKQVAKQYADWERNDGQFPYFRTFDPWIGHSYAGGTSSATGNNQESSSEAMQSWVGLFLLGTAMGDDAMRDAGAFGWVSESAATLEYWFDWHDQNLPPAYEHTMVGILFNGGFAYGTYFSASPVHIHGIQYLPINPGFRYLARDRQWAAQEYRTMLDESAAVDGHASEADFGADWAQVALGFELLFDAPDVTSKLASYIAADNGVLDDVVSGITYYYAHAMQNLGHFADDRFIDLPMSGVFENNGTYRYTAYNPTHQAVTAHVFTNDTHSEVARFTVPAQGSATYPDQSSDEGEGVMLSIAAASASSGNAQAAIDHNPGSRWESDYADPQYLQLDLGEAYRISAVVLDWEVANAKRYTLEGSQDGAQWTTLKTITDGVAGNRTDTLDGLNGAYRYLRINGTERTTQYGYSIYEAKVYGHPLN